MERRNKYRKYYKETVHRNWLLTGYLWDKEREKEKKVTALLTLSTWENDTLGETGAGHLEGDPLPPGIMNLVLDIRELKTLKPLSTCFILAHKQQFINIYILKVWTVLILFVYTSVFWLMYLFLLFHWELSW